MEWLRGAASGQVPPVQPTSSVDPPVTSSILAAPTEDLPPYAVDSPTIHPHPDEKPMRRLEVLHDCENATVDIVAVHALGANSRHAWRYQEEIDGKKTGRIINWLKDEDMLPHELPNARILGYNYGSDETTSFWDSGIELMRELCSERQNKLGLEARHRPIIFIGHSLGGIMIEQGLVNASFSNSPNTLIAKCTVGVVCFGTPHQVATSVHWGSAIASIIEAYGIGGNGRLVEDLKDGSYQLSAIIHQYLMWASKYSVDIVQFYETQQTNYGTRVGTRWNQMIVPQDVACLPGFSRIPLLADHFQLVKFKGPKDLSYMKLMPVLKKLAAEAPRKAGLRFEPRSFIQDNSQIPAVNLECQKALFISWPHSELKGIQRRLGERTPGTCEWLLSKEEYTNWIQGEKPQVFRLVGGHEMQKTMLVAFLVEELAAKLELTSGMALAFHFCDKRNQSSNNACAIVRQLLFQIYQQRPKLFHFLQKAYDIQGARLFQDFDKLWRVLFQTLKNYEEGELFILIDALDECEAKSRQLMTEALEGLAKSGLNVRILSTCHPEHDIEMAFRDDNIRTVSYKITEDDISLDIKKYIEDKVHKLCRNQGWGESEAVKIRDCLFERENGTFHPLFFILEDLRMIEWRHEIDWVFEKYPPSPKITAPPAKTDISSEDKTSMKPLARDSKTGEGVADHGSTNLEPTSAPGNSSTVQESEQPTVNGGVDVTRRPTADSPGTSLPGSSQVLPEDGQAEERRIQSHDIKASGQNSNGLDEDEGVNTIAYHKERQPNKNVGGIMADSALDAMDEEEEPMDQGGADETHWYQKLKRVSNADALPQAPAVGDALLNDDDLYITCAGTGAAINPDMDGLRRRPRTIMVAAREDYHVRTILPFSRPSHHTESAGKGRGSVIISQLSAKARQFVEWFGQRTPLNSAASIPPSTPIKAEAAPAHANDAATVGFCFSFCLLLFIVVGIFAACAQAIAVFVLLEETANAQYELPTWRDNDYLQMLSGSCWQILGMSFTVVITMKHTNEHNDHHKWITVWIVSAICFIGSGFAMGLYVTSPAWSLCTSGISSLAQVSVHFLTIRQLEGAERDETSRLQRKMKVQVDEELRDHKDKCRIRRAELNVEIGEHERQLNERRDTLLREAEKDEAKCREIKQRLAEEEAETQGRRLRLMDEVIQLETRKAVLLLHIQRVDGHDLSRS